MKARTFRSIAAVGAAFALGAMGLAACSSGDKPSTGDESESGNAVPETEDVTEPVEVSFIHRLPDGDGMVKVSEIVDRWNAENPDIQVTSTKFDGAAAEMIKKLETDINANNGPCLAMLGYGEVPEMFVKGFTQDVTEYAEQYKDNFSGAYSLMKVGDASVGLPMDTGPLVYYYNKAAFEELGIDVPTNVEEFIAASEKAAAAGKYISAFQPDEAGYWLSAQSAAAGGTWYSAANDQWVVDADSEASAVVANMWQTLLDAKTTTVLDRWGDAFTAALGSEELIGTIGASWEAPLLMDSMAGTSNEGKWAVTQLIDFGAGPMTGPDGGSGVAVMKGCEYPEQAMKFNNFFNTQIDDLVTQGLVVAAKGSMKTPDNVREFYSGQEVFDELAKANEHMTPSFGYMPNFSAVTPEMAKAAAAAGDGSGKVADVFAAAQSASVQTLKDAGLPVAE